MERFAIFLLRSGVATLTLFLLFLAPARAVGGILRSDKVLLLCHRTANRDLPENTLESLALAAHMGCDIVEVDVRRTLDGQLVLNHDGILDRFTDTTGDVENFDLRELDDMDFGAWMGSRFAGMRIAHFDDALRLARQLKVGLYLDIKTSGIGREVLAAVDQAGMANEVMFGGEWEDIRQLDSAANADPSAGVQPGFTRAQVDDLHAQHKIVIANFILNGHEFDLDGMKRAVASGVDGIMVDYPRLGAEAVGRPVEAKIASLVQSADRGPADQRTSAIRDLSNFAGFPLQAEFFRWVMDSDERISHEAALALVTERPRPSLVLFEPATRSPTAAARSSAAWAIGALAHNAQDRTQCASLLVPLLQDPNESVRRQALVGLSRCPSNPQVVPAGTLLHFLSGDAPVLRGLAAVALVHHHPEIAERAIPARLEQEEQTSDAFNADWTARGRPKLSQTEIAKAVDLYRAEMKELEALALLPDQPALKSLAGQAFRPGHDYSMMPILMGGFKLWDRLDENPEPALEALASSDGGTADWAEWALVKAGPKVLPNVRRALIGSRGNLRDRVIQILAWQADESALPLLQSLRVSDATDKGLIDWAIATIEVFRATSSIQASNDSLPK